jgi:hypothetical protein
MTLNFISFSSNLAKSSWNSMSKSAILEAIDSRFEWINWVFRDTSSNWLLLSQKWLILGFDSIDRLYKWGLLSKIEISFIKSNCQWPWHTQRSHPTMKLPAKVHTWTLSCHPQISVVECIGSIFSWNLSEFVVMSYCMQSFFMIEGKIEIFQKNSRLKI